MSESIEAIALHAAPSIDRTARFASATVAGLVLDRAFALALAILVSAAYGTSQQLDDFLFAVVGPTLVAILAGDLIYSLLLRELMEARARRGEQQAAWNLLAWTSVGLGAVTVTYALCWSIAVLVTRQGAGVGPLLALGLITSPLIFFGGVSAMCGTVLTAAGRYVVAISRIPIASLVAVLVFLAWTRFNSDVTGLAVSTVAGSFASVLVMLAATVRIVGRPSLTMSAAAAIRLLRRVVGPSLAQLAAGVMAQASTPVERLIGIGLGAGVVSSLNYGRVLTSPPLLIGQAIATASYPRFVDLGMRRSEERYRALWSSVSMVIFLLLPMSVLLAGLAPTLVVIVYQRGAFDDLAVARTTVAAIILSTGLVPIAVSSMLTRFLYADGHSGRVARASIAVLAAYCLMALGLGRFAGYAGLAAASSISYLLLTVALLYSVHLNGQALRELSWRSVLRSILASALLGVVVLGVQALGSASPSLLVRALLAVAATLTGAVVYVSATWLLRAPELFLIAAFARRLLKPEESRS